MSKVLRAVCVLTIAFIVASCATTTHYTEQFSSVMVSSDHRKFVVLGEKYHYIFDMPRILDQSLSSEFRHHLSCEFIREFSVSERGKTFGYFRLQLTDDATQEEIKEAKGLGYQVTKDGLVYFSETATGKRYRPKAPVEAAQTKLNQPYRVLVADSQAASDALIMLSPIFVTAGGVVVLANPEILLLAVPMAGLKR